MFQRFVDRFLAVAIIIVLYIVVVIIISSFLKLQEIKDDCYIGDYLAPNYTVFKKINWGFDIEKQNFILFTDAKNFLEDSDDKSYYISVRYKTNQYIVYRTVDWGIDIKQRIFVRKEEAEKYLKENSF